MAVSKLGERVRCIWHISPALLTLGLYWYTQLVRMDVFWMLLPAALCFSAVEVLRFSSAWWRETFTLVFGLMLRDYEQTRASGTMFYLWGVTTAFLLPVRTEDSVAGVLLLCFCDPVAAAAGMTWGARPGAIQLRRGKSLAGFLAACFTGVCVTYFHQSHLRAGVIENDWNVVPLGARLLCRAGHRTNRNVEHLRPR